MNRAHSEVFNANGNQQTRAVQPLTGFPMTLQSNHRTLHRQKILNNRPVSESSLIRRTSNTCQGETNNASWDQIPQQYHATKANIESKMKKADQKRKEAPPTANISVPRTSGSKKCPEIPSQMDGLDYCEHERKYRNVKQSLKQEMEMKHRGGMKQQQQPDQQPVQRGTEHKSKNHASGRVSKSKMVSSSHMESLSKNFSSRTSKKAEIAKSGKNRSSFEGSADLGEMLRRLDLESEASSKATSAAISPKARKKPTKAITNSTEQETQKKIKNTKRSSGHHRCYSELTRSCDHTQSQRFSGRSPHIDIRATTTHADINTRKSGRPNSNQQKLQRVVGEEDHKFLRDHLPFSTKCNPAQANDLQYMGTGFPTSSTRKDGAPHQRLTGVRRMSQDDDNEAFMKERQRKHIQRAQSTPSMRATHASPFANKQSKKTSPSLGELLRNVSSSHRRKKSEAKKISDKWNMVLHDGWGEF
mmetsp:Transcript_14052/g.21939  ORF Transcript_14052/g.21939 Transcript_14052/m.21939 type:complete len:473 (+) Transcript_14052:244-1662(+)|eukprot:CAMPEP_0195305448 /NCGR_PEP_ID=MMETSP0707-20130614/36282_1 /TAXON_ID=33640 /ORGANISM="Asterionellopsis glacialis, Strain CCMP134" /LENGTH=472 /DNA_ID=CAMNT_0040369571 /DNA_START=220 /DNA_END=1638 /DNA_ORIENTATION=+